ncbi:MAG: hypothetical protein H6850_01360 [Alphaproteobacteria bacterium]|nr:MAG: hypothetical protein H6850_01360 [Alphaproteobacteria bacterium]
MYFLYTSASDPLKSNLSETLWRSSNNVESINTNEEMTDPFAVTPQGLDIIEDILNNSKTGASTKKTKSICHLPNSQTS